MIIEIRGAGFKNKGAQLMLFAVYEQIIKNYPDSKIVMSASAQDGPAPYIKRARLGFYQKLQMYRFGIQFGFLTQIIPSFLRERLGIILERDIDIVIDISGFAYSDKWHNSCSELLNTTQRLYKKNIKLILLPQAFGPFSEKNLGRIKQCIPKIQKIYARDKISFNYLNGKEYNNISICPDFTNMVNPIIQDSIKTRYKEFVMIVPNYRMIDKLDNKKGYLNFLKKTIQFLVKKGEKTAFLIHEGHNDKNIAHTINKKLENPIEIIVEEDARILKGYISISKAVIGSRYHALISALSSSTPCIGTSWSHKYEELFDEYEYREGIVNVNTDFEIIESKINNIINPVEAKKIRQKLEINSIRIKKEVSSMWDSIWETII